MGGTNGTAQPWAKVGPDVVLLEGHLRVVRRRLRMPSGREDDWDLHTSVDSVAVLPLTDDGRVVCVRQYRPGPDRVVVSLPGGLLEPGETPLEAAERELREETGWSASRWEVTGSSQWFKSTETSWAAVAHGAHLVADPSPDLEEDMEVVLLSLADLRAALRSGEFSTTAQAYQALDHAGLL